jgi:hypothetical protein
MNAFSKDYKPQIQSTDLKKRGTPAKPNVFDDGTPQERMAVRAKPLPVDRIRLPNRPSKM